MTVGQAHGQRLRNANTRLRRERHRRVLDEWGVRRFAVRELHDPLLGVDFEQRFRPRAAERHAGRDQTLLRGRHRFVRLDLAHELVNLVGICERRQRAEPAWQVLVRGRRHAERSETIVAGEVEVLEQRQARGLVDEANHALPPTIRARIVDGARGRAALGRQKLVVDER